MMKIGFDAKRVFRNMSGLGNYSRSSVELLAKYYPENEYSLFSAYDDNRAGFTVPEGVKVIHPSSFLGYISPSLWRSGAMARDIRKERLDIYHGLSNELPFDIRLSGAKSIVTIHDLIFLRYPNLYKKADAFLYNFKYRQSCKNADMVIAISEQTKHDLIDFWHVAPERISVVYQGCNPIYKKKASDEVKDFVRKKYNLPENYILSVGTIEERKNLMLTLHAMHEGNIDMPLVACGKYTPYVDKLKEYIVSKGMENKVTFIHDCPLEELPSIYQMATVTVYVSLFEGFGIPIIESFYSGTPVITSRGGVFSETGGDAAFYVGQYDLEEMIDTLHRITTDSKLQEKVTEKGYRFVQNFNEDRIAANLMDVYKLIL